MSYSVGTIDLKISKKMVKIIFLEVPLDLEYFILRPGVIYVDDDNNVYQQYKFYIFSMYFVQVRGYSMPKNDLKINNFVKEPP